MIDRTSFAHLIDLLERVVLHQVDERVPVNWTSHRVALQAGKPDRLVQFSLRTRKWRIRRLTAGAVVALNSVPQVAVGDGGALLNDARPELDDRYPFVYQGEIYGVSDLDAVLTIEQWATPGPHGR